MQTRSEMDIRLMDSFKQLALRMPIEKITIKDITDQAGVIRPTFYNHFQDKYELLESIIRNDLLEPMMPLIKNGMISAALTLIFTNILKEKEFYLRVSRLEGQNSFGEITSSCICELLSAYIDEVTSGKTSGAATPLMRELLTTENIASYYATSMTFVVVRWLQTDMSITPSEMAEIYDFLMTHSLDDMVKEMQ